MSINIDDFENVIKLYNALKCEERSSKNGSSSLEGRRVIVRSRNAGVMYGTLVSVKGQHVVLTNARILWAWRNINGGNSLNDSAKDGLKEEYTRLSFFNDNLEMLEACSIIGVSHKAATIIDSIKGDSNNDR